MAGIGFELKKIIEKNTLSSILRAYSYAAVLTSGPYVISILSILFIGYMIASIFIPEKVRAFQVVITYLIAFSLIITSPFQLTYTRFVADRLFLHEDEKVLPTLNVVLIASFLLSFLFSMILAFWFFKEELGIIFSLTFCMSLTLFSGIWILNILLTSLKNYKYIVFSFFTGFMTVVLLAKPFVSSFGFDGLMVALTIGLLILFTLLYGFVVRHYPSNQILNFEIFDRKKIFLSLIPVGVFYNTAIWIDKFIFWYSPSVGEKIVSIFHGSLLYDIPIFLAYLAIIPGLAVLLVKVETDYLNYYNNYYRAVRDGETLNRIFYYGELLGIQARNALIDVLLIQLIADIIIIIFIEPILYVFGISIEYAHLFYVDLVGTTLQLFVISILAFLFYFDKRIEAVVVSFLFLVFNGVLTFISIELGPYYYGYGFTLSLLIASVVGLLFMRNFLRELHYETFMLR